MTCLDTIQKAGLHFEVAGGIPIVPFTGDSFHDREFYWAPDQDYYVDIYGTKDSKEEAYQVAGRQRRNPV